MPWLCIISRLTPLTVRQSPETLSKLNQNIHQGLQPIKLEAELKQDLCRSTPKPVRNPALKRRGLQEPHFDTTTAFTPSRSVARSRSRSVEVSKCRRASVRPITPLMEATSVANHYGYRVVKFEAVTVPLKVHYNTSATQA